MLSEYLQSAQHDLNAKQNIIEVKTQRLAIAKDHYHHLNRTFSSLRGSKLSGIIYNEGNKYNTEFLYSVFECRVNSVQLLQVH